MVHPNESNDRDSERFFGLPTYSCTNINCLAFINTFTALYELIVPNGSQLKTTYKFHQTLSVLTNILTEDLNQLILENKLKQKACE